MTVLSFCSLTWHSSFRLPYLVSVDKPSTTAMSGQADRCGSGLDGPLSCAFSKAANCPACFAEGIDSATWAHYNLRPGPVGDLQDYSAAAMVCGHEDEGIWFLVV